MLISNLSNRLNARTSAQVYLDADLLKSEGDVLRDAERALLLARGRPLDSHPAVEAAADLVWDEVQVIVVAMLD
jgi:transketolase C-terminal domain/subunit